MSSQPLDSNILLALSALPDCGARDQVMRQIAKLRDRVVSLEAALWTYGHHNAAGPNGCMVDFAADGDEQKCICGLTAIRGAEPEQPAPCTSNTDGDGK